MGAHGLDPAAGHHDDLLCPGHGGQSMGDRHHRTALRHPFDHLAEQLLVHCVELGGCLVEEQHLRFAQERPGDGNALTFATGEFDAALADLRVETRRETRQQILETGIADRARQLGFGSIGTRQDDVGAERAVEDRGILFDVADLAAQPSAIQGLYVVSTEEHATGRRLIEALDQAEQCRFARA